MHQGVGPESVIVDVRVSGKSGGLWWCGEDHKALHDGLVGARCPAASTPLEGGGPAGVRGDQAHALVAVLARASLLGRWRLRILRLLSRTGVCIHLVGNLLHGAAIAVRQTARAREIERLVVRDGLRHGPRLALGLCAGSGVGGRPKCPVKKRPATWLLLLLLGDSGGRLRLVVLLALRARNGLRLGSGYLILGHNVGD